MKHITPFGSDESKKVQVEKMFDLIAHRYDFLNHFLSFGIDKYWRRRLIKEVKKHKPIDILDIATGTGDLALAAAAISGTNVTGIDISEKMLDIARVKTRKRKGQHIAFIKGDAEKLGFPDASFDAVMVAFGIRNFETLNNGLNEINRVLRPGGLFILLEFSKPVAFPVKQLYSFYSKFLVPWFGKIFSGNKRAYSYLPESVQHFPEGLELVVRLRKVGFKELHFIPLTFRIASLYKGVKA